MRFNFGINQIVAKLRNPIFTFFLKYTDLFLK